MKKRTAFFGAILSLIPFGQPLLIKTGVVLSTVGLVLSVPERVNANNAKYYFERASKSYDKEDFSDALIYINKAIEIDPNNRHNFAMRAAIKGRMGNKAGGCADLKKTILMPGKTPPTETYLDGYDKLNCHLYN